jgi:hypothetical protein
MPYEAPDLANLSLSDIAELVAARKLPPVESWTPEQTGDSEMRIAADGKHWLVTPQQKLSIAVDDAPFIAVELQSEGEGKDRTLAFRLNSDDLVFADADHTIEMRNGLPYLHVRGGLWAKLARPVYYELANLALAEDPEGVTISSKGAQFSLMAPA